MRKPNHSLTGMPRVLTALTVVLAVACAAGVRSPEVAMGPQERTGGGGAVPAAGRAWLVFGSDTVTAEVASTPDQRSQGLMNRATLPVGTGMLFVFQDQAVRSFWMRNTLISLDIAFMDDDFRILDIQQMEAMSEEFHDSRFPARYALEVPEGWFAAHGVRVGDKPTVVFGGG
jgi:uncharacterized membrane protein (UPF0127 family)